MALNRTTLLYGTNVPPGQPSAYEPRVKYQYSIDIVLNSGDWGNVENALSGAGVNVRSPKIGKDRTAFTFRAQSIELPSHTYDVQSLNQYNRKRIITTSIQYNPITMVCHDTIDSTLENLIRAYNLYYFGNFEKPIRTYDVDTTPNKGVVDDYDTLPGEPNSPELTGYGYKPPTKNLDKYFIKQVKIYREFGAKKVIHDADSGSRVEPRTIQDEVAIINPMITQVQHDTLSYADSSPIAWQLTFMYEAIEYGANIRNNE